jgi:hypothetical protein
VVHGTLDDHLIMISFERIRLVPAFIFGLRSRTLRNGILDRRLFSRFEAGEIFCQFVSAILNLQNLKGIIHRDLRGMNIVTVVNLRFSI